MEIIEHGDWVLYTPETTRGLPPNVLHARRVSDGQDWYQYQREALAGVETIKATVRDEVVQATALDASYLFPAGTRLIEVVGADVAHEALRRMRIERGAFLPPPPLAVPRFALLIALHYAGRLEAWRAYLADHPDPALRIALEADRHLTFEDRYLRAAARGLGWDEATLRELFTEARTHG